MKKYPLIRRIAAWAGIILLLTMYIVTFVLAVSGKASKDLLIACLVSTVLVSVILYAMILVTKRLENRSADDREENKPSKKH